MSARRTAKKRRRVATGICLAISPPIALGQPLYDQDNGPLTGIFGIPDSTEGASLVPVGRSSWDVALITSSHSLLDSAGAEAVLLDGETTRFELRYRYGISDRVEVGVEIPYVWHESGGLDSLVDSWHDWFGFPGGFRRTRPYDKLEIRYEDGNGTRFDLSNNTNGLGDVRLVAGWQLYDGADHDIAVRIGAKLPTGDSDGLLGSGGFDYSVGIAGDVHDVFGIEGLSTFYRLHGARIGQPDVLADLTRADRSRREAGAVPLVATSFL